MGGGGSKPAGPPPLGDYEPPAKRVFRKGTPPEKVTLTISEAAGCPTCSVRTDGGMTISSVMMTRDILGKVDGPMPKATSDSWVWDDAVAFRENGKPYLVENDEEINERCKAKCQYKRADPKSFGQEVAGKRVDGQGLTEANDGNGLRNAFKADIDAWSANQRSNAAKSKARRQQVVRMWNPSDSPTDGDGAIALNYETHGALTKLYLKPTLPFNLTFSA